MIDILSVMACQTDIELSRRLGVELDWTAFVADTLKQRRERSDNAVFEDMVTDIVTNLILALDGENALSRKIEWCKATSPDDFTLENKVKAVMATAVHLRFRDFRQRPSHRIGRRQMPDERIDPVSYDWPVGAELEAESLQGMIEAELSARQAKAKGMKRTVLDRAITMFPDRLEGLGIREICEKHEWNRGKIVSSALKEIYRAVESVANRLQEGWILALLK